MTRTFNISVTAKTAHQTGADFGVRTGPAGGSLGYAMRRSASPRSVIVEASRNVDALAERGAG
jgi:hypothetical protein